MPHPPVDRKRRAPLTGCAVPFGALVTRFGIAPLLDRRLPVGLRRRLLDVTGRVAPLPPVTRRASGLRGGVPTVVVSAVSPDAAHSAAWLEDALAAFRALHVAGHVAQRIAVVGDSAGGGLAMSLVVRLRAAGEELPGSLGLISSGLDLA